MSFTGSASVPREAARWIGHALAETGTTIDIIPDGSRASHDLNGLANRLVGEATGQRLQTLPMKGKDPAVIALGPKGGLKGAKARAAKMTPEARSDAARKAAAARSGRRS
mgnify:CR=1 FL=1